MHVKSLDAARGAAACLVAVDHFINLVVDPADGSALRYAASFTGSFGVGLFFLISGFVIPQTLRRGSWDFAVRRVFRLYPVAWCAAVLALILNRLAGGDNDTFFSTVSLVGSLFHYNTDLLQAVYWTLTIEVAFYVLAGLVGLVTRRGTDGRLAYYLLLAVCAMTILIMKIAPAGTTPTRVGLLVILCCWPMLFIGWFAYLLCSGEIDQPLFLIGVATACATLSVGLYPYFAPDLGAPSWMLAFGVFAVLVFGRPLSLTGAMSRGAAHVGTLSFGIYVIHVPIASALRRIDAPLIAKVIAYVAAVAVGSWVMHRAVERPGIALGKRVAEMRSFRGRTGTGRRGREDSLDGSRPLGTPLEVHASEPVTAALAEIHPRGLPELPRPVPRRNLGAGGHEADGVPPPRDPRRTIRSHAASP